MSYDPVPISLFAGINRGVSEDSLSDGEVARASNFLFRRGESVLRPGLSTVPVTNPITKIVFARSILGNGLSSTTLFLTQGKLYKLDSLNVATEITGGAAPIFFPANANATAINGVVYIGNNQSGGNDLFWDPSGVTYALLTGDGRWRYLTAIGTRGFGAYRTAGASTDPISVGWSDQGDATNWAVGGASTAGSTVIADMTEDISGLGTLHNLAVICRHTGFHIGYPTGIAFPPFRFEAWNRDGVGVFYPETIDTSNNVMYFVGEDDVYTFDLQQITPIGARIRDELLPILRSGILYRGFVARGTFGEARSTYNLVPINIYPSSVSMPPVVAPHYIYDIYEQTWSRADYDLASSLLVGCYRYPISSGGVCFFDNAGNLRIWNSEIPCETKASLTTGTKFIGPLNKDLRIDGVLLKHRNFVENMAVNVFVNGQLADKQIEASERRTLGEDTGDTSWARTWFRSNIVGQGFKVRIEVDAGQRFSTNFMQLTAQEAGEYKGRFA